MSSTGFHDPLFVHFYEQTDNTRQIDLAYYLAQAELARTEKPGLPILDAGCGSGRILIPLAEQGHTVHGFDSSAVMLEAASARLASKNLQATLWLDRLEDFTATPNTYSLVLCSFNTFLHLLDHNDQLSALRRIHDALAPGGRFILDITNPYNFEIFSRRKMGKTFEATLYDSATDTQTTIWRWFERDLVKQIGVYHREYETAGEGGTEVKETEVTFRWTYPEEMRLLLSSAGFTDLTLTGDYSGEDLHEESEMQVWSARARK